MGRYFSTSMEWLEEEDGLGGFSGAVVDGFPGVGWSTASVAMVGGCGEVVVNLVQVHYAFVYGFPQTDARVILCSKKRVVDH